jgi:hypothetical protein
MRLFQRSFLPILVLVSALANAVGKDASTPKLRSRQPAAIQEEAPVVTVVSGHNVRFSDTHRNATSIAMPPAATTASLQHRRTQQTRTILILRIVNNGIGPTADGNAIRQYVFNDPNSLKFQMMRCSANAIIFNPAPYGSGGVVDVAVQTAMSVTPLMEAAVNQAARAVGVPDLRKAADHVMFIFPKVNGYFAEGEAGNTYSFYNDELGLSLSVLLHEVGHNYGAFFLAVCELHHCPYSICIRCDSNRFATRGRSRQ